RGSGDQGIDILAEKDGVRFGIQCKCYAQDVGNSAVREAFAGKAYYGCHVAAVLTNRNFTHAAIEAAAGMGVVLWDREKLRELWLGGKDAS
ncbi:MAG: restriction endonuclease, partial [Coriobacteriales bacterium]